MAFGVLAVVGIVDGVVGVGERCGVALCVFAVLGVVDGVVHWTALHVGIVGCVVGVVGSAHRERRGLGVWQGGHCWRSCRRQIISCGFNVLDKVVIFVLRIIESRKIRTFSKGTD